MIGLILLLAYGSATGANGEIIQLRIELDTSQSTKVVMTDGSIQNTPMNATWRGCGIGPGIIFIKNEFGVCQTMDSFNIKRGSVNQLHLDTSKSKYYDSTLTFIQEDWLTTSGTLAPEFYKAALKGSPGRSNDQGKLVDISLTKGSVTSERTINGFHIFRLSVDTTIITKASNGIFCSTSAHSCANSWTTGSLPDEVIYGEGRGVIGFVVIKQLPNPYPTMRIIVWPGDDTKYFPQELTQLAGLPLGVTFETALKAGLKSTSSDLYLFQEHVARKKRFIAIALSAAALARVEGVNEALQAALAVSDAKDREHEAAIKLGFQYTKILGEKIANTMELSLDLNERIYTLSLQNEVLGIMLEQLALKVDYLEQFVLFVVDYFQTREAIVYQNLDKYRTVILEKYPGGRILTEKQIGTAIYYTLTVNGNILTTNVLPPCSQDRCYLPGNWYKFISPRSVTRVLNPLVGIYDCGLYFQTPGILAGVPQQDDANLQVIAYMGSIELAKAHIVGKGFGYAYVNLLDCPSDFQLTSGMLHEANALLARYGFDKIQTLADNRFLVNCTPVFGNITDNITDKFKLYIKEDIVCSQRISYEELRTFVSRIQIPVFEQRSALDAYRSTLKFTTSFERVFEKLGAAGLDALTQLVGIPGDVLSSLASGEILKTNSMSKASLGVAIVALLISVISAFLLMCFIAKQGKRRKISEESKKESSGMGQMNPTVVEVEG